MFTAHTKACVSSKYASPAMEEVLSLLVAHSLPPTVASEGLAVHGRIGPSGSEHEANGAVTSQVNDRPAVTSDDDLVTTLGHRNQIREPGLSLGDTKIGHNQL